jgi:hypothetical protein
MTPMRLIVRGYMTDPDPVLRLLRLIFFLLIFLSAIGMALVIYLFLTGRDRT